MSNIKRAVDIYNRQGFASLLNRTGRAAKRWSIRHYWRFRGIRPLTVGSQQVVIGNATPSEHSQIWTYTHSEKKTAGSFISKLRSDDIFFDVGANIGIYSLAGAMMGAETHAFEPHPNNAQTLQKNQHRNSTDFTIHQAGLGAENGEVVLVCDPSDNAEGTAALATDNDTKEDGVTIPVWRGDEYCEAKNLEYPTAMKIDVEGAEASVVRGFEKSLEESLRLLLVEVHRNNESGRSIQDYGMSAEEFEDYLRQLGYSLTIISDRGGQYHILAER